MREAAHAEQRNRRVGTRRQTDTGRADHAQAARHHHKLARCHQRHREALLEPRREIAAKHASDVRRQERQPGKQRDLLQVHMALGGHVERNPIVERLPRRLREKARDGDAPEAAAADDLAPRRLGRIRVVIRRFLACTDVVALLCRQAMVLGRHAIQQEPEHAPHQSHPADHGKGKTPVAVQDAPDHQRRRHHRAHGRADVEPARGDRSLLGGEPLCRCPQRRREACRLRHPQHGAERRQRQPTTRRAVQQTDHRPRRRKQRKTQLGAQHVEHIARHRLHHHVGRLECRDDVAVLLCADVQHLVHFRRRHRQRIARQVVHDQAAEDEADDPPAQAFDG
ncbi:hypothetical protein COLO4_01132, partial [Corchorus olitorius]